MRTRLLSVLPAYLVLVTACDSTGPELDVGSIIVSAAQNQLPLRVGGSTQLSASVLNTTGSTMSNVPVQWTSSQPEIADVSAGGLVTGRAGGKAIITASAGNVSGQLTMTVTPADCSTAMTAGTIAPGEVRNGALTASDCLFETGVLAQGWRLTLASETSIRVDLGSAAFDALVVITDMSLTVRTWADDSPNSADAVLFATLPAGEYVIWATSFDPVARGPYRLEIQHGPVACTTAMTVDAIAAGETRAGALTTTDCLLPNQSFGDGWRFSTTAPMTLRAHLSSNEFPELIVLTDMNLVPLTFGHHTNADSGASFITALPPGEYVIWATSYSHEDLGAYQIQVEQLETASCAGDESIAIGQTVSGVLQQTDCIMSGGRFADVYRFTTDVTTTVQIDLGSSAFDAYLLVSDSTGSMLHENDDHQSLDSRIVATLQPGAYLFWASSYGPGETGPYQLRVSTASAAGNALAEGVVATPPGYGGSVVLPLAWDDLRRRSVEGGAKRARK